MLGTRTDECLSRSQIGGVSGIDVRHDRRTVGGRLRAALMGRRH
jgi:hypothetical protein